MYDSLHFYLRYDSQTGLQKNSLILFSFLNTKYQTCKLYCISNVCHVLYWQKNNGSVELEPYIDMKGYQTPGSVGASAILGQIDEPVCRANLQLIE